MANITSIFARHDNKLTPECLAEIKEACRQVAYGEAQDAPRTSMGLKAYADRRRNIAEFGYALGHDINPDYLPPKGYYDGRDN